MMNRTLKAFGSVWVCICACAQAQRACVFVNMSQFVLSTAHLSVGEQIQADHVSVSQGLVQRQIPLCVTKDT